MSETTVTVTDAGPCAKKLSLTIPADAIKSKLGDTLDTLASEAEMPGFRRGRAPRRLVEKRFGQALRGETKKQLVSEAFAKAIEEHKLEVVGEPFTDEALQTMEIEEGKPFEFAVEVEVVPDFTLPTIEGVEVSKPLIEVSDEMVDAELARICMTEGTLEEQSQAAAGDYATGRAVMTDADGKEHYNIDGAVVQCPTPDKGGKGMILGVMVDDFEKQLGLPKPGDTVSIKTMGPEGHEVEALRGKKLTITFDVQRIDRIIPATPETLAERVGFESVDAMKEQIRGQLFNRLLIRQQVVMRQQVAKHLSDGVEFELPARLTARQAERTLQRRQLEMLYRGVPRDVIEEHLATMRSQSQQAAARELKLFFILQRAANQMGVQVTEGDVNARITQIARSRNMRPDALRSEIIRTNQVGTIVQQIREHKALDRILEQANITEMSIADFNAKFAGDPETEVKA